jgi:DNA-binding GntR family transcriptional regulator
VTRPPDDSETLQGQRIGTTLSERIAEVVRHRILTLAAGYQPGERLYPGQLARDLGVSVTPVREALRALAGQGLIEFSPRRGLTVARPSTADLDDLVAVLAGLEMLAFRLSGGRVEPEHLARLQRCLAECERAIAAEDIRAYRASDDEFHRTLVAISRSPRLVGLYDSLLRQAQIVEVQNPRYLAAMRESLEDHRELLADIVRGDVGWSEKAIELHWERSRERLRRKIGEFLDAPPPPPPR